MKKLISFFLGGVMVLSLTACDYTPSSDQVQRQQQETLSQQGNMTVGMPAINNFFEKKLLKVILEMRDNPKLVTYTYITDLNGHLHKRCNSIGYGIPYATQFTNPQRVARSSETSERGNITLPQADPNGLFSPSSAEGTWVLCQNPANKDDLRPVYLEDRVTVSPFELTDQ